MRKIHGIISIFRTEFPRSYFWINCKSSRRLSFPIFIPSLISVIAMKCCLFSPLYRRDPDRNLFDTYIYVNTAYTGLQNTAEPTLLPGAGRLPRPPSPGQNAWKSGQNQWKSGQTTWNYGQRWRPTMFDFEKFPPNVVIFWKIDAQHVQNHMKTFFMFFWRSSQNKVFMICVGRIYSHKELPENISGKFGEILAKLFCTP